MKWEDIVVPLAVIGAILFLGYVSWAFEQVFVHWVIDIELRKQEQKEREKDAKV